MRRKFPLLARWLQWKLTVLICPRIISTAIPGLTLRDKNQGNHFMIHLPQWYFQGFLEISWEPAIKSTIQSHLHVLEWIKDERQEVQKKGLLFFSGNGIIKLDSLSTCSVGNNFFRSQTQTFQSSGSFLPLLDSISALHEMMMERNGRLGAPAFLR